MRKNNIVALDNPVTQSVTFAFVIAILAELLYYRFNSLWFRFAEAGLEEVENPSSLDNSLERKWTTVLRLHKRIKKHEEEIERLNELINANAALKK